MAPSRGLPRNQGQIYKGTRGALAPYCPKGSLKLKLKLKKKDERKIEKNEEKEKMSGDKKGEEPSLP